MLFSSIPFLYYFLPTFLIVYFIVPNNKIKNLVLFVFSILFYAWGEPKYVLLMLASIIVGYVDGLLIEKYEGKRASKICLIIGVLLCLLGLLYFKYADFFIGSFSAVTGLSIKLLRVTLPIGISFYTFQIISYLVDVYRGQVTSQKNIIDFASFVAMFPQLIAGPIVRYKDIEKELYKKSISSENIYEGIRRFVYGLSKKILLANVLGEFVEKYRVSDNPTIAFVWLYALTQALHIYFDFSGYSDMAIGLGRILGFSFPENFDYPFVSKSATEFWRRWHMTLGGWFRDYVYIPLGGNRVSSLKRYRNIFVVWLLTGLWHGADWTFVLWGLLFAVLLVIEKNGLHDFMQKTKIISHIYMFFVILISFTIFSANGISGLLADLKDMFGISGLNIWNFETYYFVNNYLILIIMSIFFATPLAKKVFDRIFKLKGLEVLAVMLLLLLDTAFLVDGSFNPFLYFRF